MMQIVVVATMVMAVAAVVGALKPGRGDRDRVATCAICSGTICPNPDADLLPSAGCSWRGCIQSHAREWYDPADRVPTATNA